MSFSIYQSKKFRNSWLVLGDLTPLSTVQNRHEVIYQTFQRLLASVKTQQNSSNGHYCYSSCEKLKLVIFHLLCHVYGTTHILLHVFHTLCNMARQLRDALQLHEKRRKFGHEQSEETNVFLRNNIYSLQFQLKYTIFN